VIYERLVLKRIPIDRYVYQVETGRRLEIKGERSRSRGVNRSADDKSGIDRLGAHTILRAVRRVRRVSPMARCRARVRLIAGFS
jgi:hypothetical protein